MSWDAYPPLHGEDSWRQAVDLSLPPRHLPLDEGRAALPADGVDARRTTNWQQTPQLKKPGQHRQEMLLAIGHGADTTMYFQWRKSRGAAEKFHGAVVDHGEAERTRVFQDVAAHGAFLKHLDAVVARPCGPRSALVYDWEVRWALDVHAGAAPGPSRGTPFDKEYVRTVPGPLPAVLEARHPASTSSRASRPSTATRLIVAPMLFMLKPGVAEPARRRSSRTAARSCSPTCPAS